MNMTEFKVKADSENRPTKSNDGIAFIFIGWVLVAGALVYYPIILAAFAFLLGYIVKAVFKRDVQGVALMIFSVVAAIFGTVWGYLVGLG